MSVDPGQAVYDFFLLHPEIDRTTCRIEYFPGWVGVWQAGERTGYSISLE